MKNHIAFKFIAILLCACCLLLAVAAGISTIFLTGYGLYDDTPDALFQDNKESRVWELAHNIALKYASVNLGGCPEELGDMYGGYSVVRYFPDSTKWSYTIADENGTVLENTCTDTNGTEVYSYTMTVFYPTVLRCLIYENGVLVEGDLEPSIPVTIPEETVPQSEAANDPTMATQPQYRYIENHGYSDGEYSYHYSLGMQESAPLLVTVYLLPEGYAGNEAEQLVTALWHYRYQLPIITGVALLLFAALLVYLCCAAAKAPGKEELQPGGLNRLPLDLYALGVGLACLAAAIFFADVLVYEMEYMGVWLSALILGAMGFVLSLLIVGFLFACAAQFKMGKLYWLRHSLIGMAALLLWRILRWCWRTVRRFGAWLKKKLPLFTKKVASLFRGIWSALKKLALFFWMLVCRVWNFCWNAVKRFFLWIWSKLVRFCQLLPLTWQWLLTAFIMGLLLIIGFQSRNITALFLSLAACAGIVFYGTHAFGTLLESVKRMSQGDLDTKVNDSLMIGSFKDFSGHLNDLADVATLAAQKQMKSERMKAELVTNVSHDIKTPLTSIINYVDLLQKCQTQEEAEEYLEVLARQSQRMKKLIEDLMEMSKATTGNLHVDITQVDAGEAVNQALGEFADKLSAANLTPVFHAPEKPVMMRADGRLAWRVLSNLLSNAVKYALPGTRLYIDLVKLDNQVLISLKNISREALNVSSDELMERFVRGDATRITEGSGLGLNIARSLMEVQGGQLQLLIDGDLFKATLIFPSI